MVCVGVGLVKMGWGGVGYGQGRSYGGWGGS